LQAAIAKGQLGSERDQTVGGLRKTRHKGVARVGSAFTQPRRSAATPGPAPGIPVTIILSTACAYP
jgi:hypothetical protein